MQALSQLSYTPVRCIPALFKQERKYS
jgi:hypothetical protein